MIPGTTASQSPLSMEFSRQEYWSRLPFPSPGINDLIKEFDSFPIPVDFFFHYQKKREMTLLGRQRLKTATKMMSQNLKTSKTQFNQKVHEEMFTHPSQLLTFTFIVLLDVWIDRECILSGYLKIYSHLEFILVYLTKLQSKLIFLANCYLLNDPSSLLLL